jgi:hypothetical protein
MICWGQSRPSGKKRLVVDRTDVHGLKAVANRPTSGSYASVKRSMKIILAAMITGYFCFWPTDPHSQAEGKQS